MRIRSPIPSRRQQACKLAGERLSAHMDGALSIAERREMNIHLRDCPKCSSDYEMLSLARNAVKRLPMQTPPADLDARLHLIAMRESARRTGELAGRTPLGFAWEAMRIRIENVMRPLAIPFAGGLVSTLVLFSMLAPTYPRKAARSLQQDVPTVFYQEPTVKSVAPFAFSEEDFLIEVTLDETGQVIGYTFPEGQVDPVLRREIESTLLFARFTPALAFGQPTAGKIRLSFRRAFIDVKG